MSGSRLWLTVLAVLTALWSAVGVVMHLTDDYVSSPDEVLTLMNETPWLKSEGTTSKGALRANHINAVAQSLSSLDFEQRREVRDSGGELPDRFFASLNADEKKSYVDRTVQKHLDAVIKGFNAMSPDERKNIVGRMRRDVRGIRGNSKDAEKMIEEDQKGLSEFLDLGIEEYLKSASTEEKMRLAPLIEDMLSRLQGFRR
jgi:hypothetical protein